MTVNLTPADLAPYGYPPSGATDPSAKCYNRMLWQRALSLRWLDVYGKNLPKTDLFVKKYTANAKFWDKKIAEADRMEKEYCELNGYEYIPPAPRLF
jgi:hypothetical protein